MADHDEAAAEGGVFYVALWQDPFLVVDSRYVQRRSGNGPAFSAGANLKDNRTHTTTKIGEYTEGQHNHIYDATMNCPKPIIAAVNGPAIGAGATMALGCDIRIASSAAIFSWPQASFGIIPANGTLVRLSRIVGTGMALELALSARKIDASEVY